MTEAKITNDVSNCELARRSTDLYQMLIAILQNDSFGGNWGMPFHPTCFEIFKRVCLSKLGYVDIDGLWRVRDVSASVLL